MLRRILPSLLLAAAVPTLATAQLTQAGSRAVLTGGTFDWSTINAGPGIFGLGFSAGSTVSGVSFAVTRAAGNPMELRTEGTASWAGMFTNGERILWSGFDALPLTFTFASAISGFGAQIHSNAFGAFAGSMEFFNGATSLGTASINGNNQGGSTGTAPFLGATSTTAFNRVVVSMPTNGGFGLAINRFSINTTVIPEPSTYALLGTGFIALIVVARRRRQA
jgi:hypothetical protein